MVRAWFGLTTADLFQKPVLPLFCFSFLLLSVVLTSDYFSELFLLGGPLFFFCPSFSMPLLWFFAGTFPVSHVSRGVGKSRLFLWLLCGGLPATLYAGEVLNPHFFLLFTYPVDLDFSGLLKTSSSLKSQPDQIIRFCFST